MNLVPPSEASLVEAARALAHGTLRGVARRVRGLARREHFYYKRRTHHPVGIVPLVLNRRHAPLLERLSRTLFRFQLRAPELYRSDFRGFRDLIRLERRTSAWFAGEDGRPTRGWEHLLRPDYTLAVRDGALSPVLFELNSLMLGGLHIQSVALGLMRRVMLPALGRLPGMDRLTPGVDLLSFLKDWLVECRRRAGGEGGLAFLENWPPHGGFTELPRITRFFRRAGLRAEHGDPRDLEVRGERVFLRGMPVAYAYRDFSFEDVGGPRNPRLKAFRKLWRDGRVAPGFPADFDQKGILECFTSPDFERLFSRSEAALLKAHVPWTRVLTARKTTGPDGRTVDLPEFVFQNREGLVLKPSWSSGGEGILIGRRVAPARWEAALARAVAVPGAYAIQSYVDSQQRTCAYLRDGEAVIQQCRFTIGMFRHHRGSGYHVRVSPKDVVNVAQGGALTPLYFGT